MRPDTCRAGGRGGGVGPRDGHWHDAKMNRNDTGLCLRRAATTSIVLAVLATACSHPASGRPAASRTVTIQTTPSSPPGRVDIHTGPISLDITHATALLDTSGSGMLTLTVHNGGAAPEHLDMVATPHGGRGTLQGGTGNGNGSMTTAGILIRPDSTVTFDGKGPRIRLTTVQGITVSHTLPLSLEFGIAGLISLDAVVQGPS